MSKNDIAKFIAESKVNEQPTIAEFKEAVKSAYKDRARQVYFIWKKLKELYPEETTGTPPDRRKPTTPDSSASSQFLPFRQSNRTDR